MGHKVLLADDSITVQKIVKLSLTEEGVEVIAVGNGEQAVQQLETLRPDLVMADVFMPGKDGYEVCEFVKSHPHLNQTPVILLVHAFEPFDPERAQKVGADHQLTKPFQSIRTLVTTVCDLLQASTRSATSSPEPIATATASASGSPSFSSQPVSKPAEEEFAVVASLTPATNSFPEPAVETVAMPNLATTSGPEVLTPVTPMLTTEASLPLPLTTTSSLPNKDILPPSELPVLSQTGWQPTAQPQTGWQSSAPPLADVSTSAVNHEVLAPAFSSLAPMATAAVTDDVLELSDVLPPPAPMAPVVSLTSQLASEVPLLAVLSTLPTEEQEVQPTITLTESAPPIFAGSFDLGTGHLSPQAELQPNDNVNLSQDLNLSTVAQPAPASDFPISESDFPISEAVIEEIVNRVIQRLSTNAIQEIAWEVVPEMAELLIRKQISQQKHLAH